MLFKLIKHEIKHSARYTITVYAAVLCAIAVVGLSLLFNSGIMGFVSCLALYVVGFAAVAVTLVSVIKNFYDTLYGKQGYLTFTLPVKCSSLLVSKVLVSFFWIIVSFLLMALTYVMIFFYAKQSTGDLVDTLSSAISVSGIMEMLPKGIVVIQFVLILAAIAILTVFTYVGYVYFTVTVANTRALQAHPKLFGGIIFFSVFAVVNAIGNKLTMVLPLTVNVTTEKVYFALHNMQYQANTIFTYGIGGTIFSSLVALGLLFATGYFMEHKVNVK